MTFKFIDFTKSWLWSLKVITEQNICQTQEKNIFWLDSPKPLQSCYTWDVALLLPYARKEKQNNNKKKRIEVKIQQKDFFLFILIPSWTKQFQQKVMFIFRICVCTST